MSSTTLQPHAQHPPRSPLQQNVEQLCALIHRDVFESRRGALAAEFKTLIVPYLVTDPTSDQLLQIQRAAAPYPKFSALANTLSHDTFKDFIVTEGPLLQDHYLEFKARGHTGCAVVSEDATRRLNRIAPKSAATVMSPDGLHYFTQASIEGRDYWIDFTIDQFVAYADIVAYTGYKVSHKKLDRVRDCAGILVMPGKFD